MFSLRYDYPFHEYRPIKFSLRDDPTFGMVNLGSEQDDIEDELIKLNDLDRIVISQKSVIVHFPTFDRYWEEIIRSKDGFRLDFLLREIQKVGLNAEKALGEEFMGEYAITSSENASDLKLVGNHLYVELQH